MLAGIGRRHSAQDILDCYADARRAGHEDINMDLIAGLPGDTVAGFEHSLRQAIALDPENITVHTLTLKRASRIVIEDQKENDYADVAAMLEKCQLLADAGYRPYYLYRQKNTLQNLENVGWCKPEFSGQFKRDYKLAIKRGCDPKKLEEVITLLCNEQPLPEICGTGSFPEYPVHW